MALWNKSRKLEGPSTKTFVDHMQIARKTGSGKYRDDLKISSDEAKRTHEKSITLAEGYALRKAEFSDPELEARIEAIVNASVKFELPP